VRFNELTQLMHRMWTVAIERGQPQQTIGLFGPPGIGKTSAGRDLATMMTETRRATDPGARPAVARVLDLSSMNPEDLLGLPFRHGEVTTYCPTAWLAELCEPDAYGVLVLDDLPAASQAVQVAARQISLERRVHDHRLAPGVFVVITGNRREDKSAASTLPAHFRNSIMMLSVEIDIDDWCVWYGKQPHHDPVIAAFLRFKQERLSMLPKDADKAGAFATPRTWAMLGRSYDVADVSKALLEVASGLVGEGVAREFAAFVRIRATLVDPAKVFDDPQVALPNPESLNSPDKLVAMATALCEISAVRSKTGKGKQKADAPLKLLRALAWATRDHREYCGTGVSTYIANNGSLPDMVRVARAHRSDPVIGALLVHLKSALMEGM